MRQTAIDSNKLISERTFEEHLDLLDKCFKRIVMKKTKALVYIHGMSSWSTEKLDSCLSLVENLLKEIQALQDSLEFSQQQVATLLAEKKLLCEAISSFTMEISQLAKENKSMKKSLLDLQARNMRENLMLHAT